MAHEDPHPLAERRAQVTNGRYEGAFVVVVDWFDRLTGRSWAESMANDHAAAYAWRSAYERYPIDDEVVFVRLHLGPVLLHQSELKAVDVATVMLADATREVRA